MSFWKNIQQEIAIIRERDPAIHSNMEVFLYPSFKVMLSYRRAHKLYVKGHYFWARWVSQRAARKTGIEIHPGAQIGKGLLARQQSLEITVPYIRALHLEEPEKNTARDILRLEIM